MKKISLVLFAIAIASLSQASELWWTVGDGVEVDDVSTSWDTAKLYASSQGFNYGGTEIDSQDANYLDDWGFAQTDISSYDSSSYSFYVELYNSGTLVGKSYVSKDTPQQGAISYSTLDSGGAIYGGGMMNPTGGSAYTFNSFTTANVIPEPTSGLLVLLGMMALGLKRKRG